jgi:broad specificity phosphatase PhoE
MIPTLVWMRHGTCDDGLCRPGAHARPGSPLTIAGIVEAELTAQRLHQHGWPPALVVSSPLLRARQTAAVAATTLTARIAEPTVVFAEWHAPYCVLGRTSNQYPPDYLAWRERRSHELGSALPGGESLSRFADRAVEAMAVAGGLARDNGAILIASHRLLIGAVAALHNGYWHPADIFGFAGDFRLAPAHLWAAPARETT